MDTEVVSVTEAHGSGTPNETLMVEQLGEYRMREPLFFDIRLEDDWIHLRNDAVHIYACGPDMRSAKKDLHDEIDIAWYLYVERKDAKLHPTALRLRQWLLDHMEKVTRWPASSPTL